MLVPEVYSSDFSFLQMLVSFGLGNGTCITFKFWEDILVGEYFFIEAYHYVGI